MTRRAVLLKRHGSSRGYGSSMHIVCTVREKKVSFELFDLCRVTCVQYLFKTVLWGPLVTGRHPTRLTGLFRTRVHVPGLRAPCALSFSCSFCRNEELHTRESVYKVCYHQIGLASVVVIVTMVLAKVRTVMRLKSRHAHITYTARATETARLTECASRRWSAWRCSRTQTRDESAALVSLAATQSRWRAPGCTFQRSL